MTVATGPCFCLPNIPLRAVSLRFGRLFAIIASLMSIVSSGSLIAQEDLADVIERCERSVVRIEVSGKEGRSLGSGFVVDSSGIIITNVHVLQGASTAIAHFPDGRIAAVEGTRLIDAERDIAVAKITLTNLTPLRLSTGIARKGERVVALGSPHGLSFTATVGVVSAVRSSKELDGSAPGESVKGTWIQVDAALSPGNSGGPLINELGEVVAMSTLASQGSAQNLNFGISAKDIQDSITLSVGQPWVSLSDGVGRLAKADMQESAPGGMIEPATIPREKIEYYVNEAKETFSDLVKGLRTESKRVATDLREMKAAYPFIPPEMDNGEVDILRMTSPKTRTRKWYFRGEGLKRREVTRQERLNQQLTRALGHIDGEDKQKALFELLRFYGPPLEIRRNNTVGFMTNAIVLHAYNEHDCLIVYEGIPMIAYVDSTAGLSLGQELPAMAVYVTGTATVPIRGVTTQSVTVIQSVPEDKIKEVVYGVAGSVTRNDDSELPMTSGSGSSSSSAGSSDSPDDLFAKETEDGMRVWYDRTGKFRIEAVLLSTDDKKVYLRKKDGKVVDVPIDKLSDADLKYLGKK